MSSESPSQPLDLLVIGALTVDRFTDGSSAPGGSVLHISRASARRGVRVGVVTVAGPEPEAQAGLAELRRLAALLEVTKHDATWTFRHRESARGRRLWLERAGGMVALGPDASSRILTDAILYAPVADEIDESALRIWPDDWTRAAILQGWLRTATEGAEVNPRPLSAIEASVRDDLAGFELLVASREDLVASATEPDAQLAGMREWSGLRPMLVVTDSDRGVWLDATRPGRHMKRREHVPVPFLVQTPDTVGAGDVLAAFLAMAVRANYPSDDAWASEAMRITAEELHSRTLD